MLTQPEDLSGQTFGRVTVLEFSHGTGSRCYWKCTCKCGRDRVLRSDFIKSGPTCALCRRNDIANSKEPRQCCRCKRILARDRFHKNSANVDGINHICKECNKAHVAVYIRGLRKRALSEINFPESKKCRECELVKSANDFWLDKTQKDGLAPLCAECLGAASRHWYQTVGKNDPERLNKARAARHGLELSRIHTMLAEQEGKCKICGLVFEKSSDWAVDHDHRSSAIRGLLCRPCNMGLGYFKDSTTSLASAITYLESASGVLATDENRKARHR